MNKLTFTFLIVLTVTLLASPLRAQDTPEQRRKEIDRLMEVTGMAKIADQVMDQVLLGLKTQHPDLPDEFVQAFRKKINAQDLIGLIRPIYEKYYSVDDLRAIIVFYESPTGKKMLTTMPQLMGDVMKVSQEWGQRVAKEAVQEMLDKKNKNK